MSDDRIQPILLQLRRRLCVSRDYKPCGEEMITITREDLEYIGNALEDCQSIATGYCAALGIRGDKIREQFWHANANEALAKIDEILAATKGTRG